MALALGLASVSAAAWGVWAFRTGRAVELLRRRLVADLEARCGLLATFDRLSLDPVERLVHLEALRLAHVGGEEWLAVEEAQVEVDVLPFLYGRVQLRRVSLLAPAARVVVRGGRVENLPPCLQTTDDAARPLALGIRELTIERGRVALAVDDALEVRLDALDVSLRPGRWRGTDLVLGVKGGEVARREAAGAAPLRLALSRLRLSAHLEGLLARPRALAVERLELALGPLSLEGDGSLDFLGPVFDARLAVRAPLEELAALWPGAPSMAGAAELRVAVAGDPLAPRLAGEAAVAGGRILGIGLGDRLEASFRADTAGLEVDRLAVAMGEGAVTGRASLGFAPGLPLRVEARASQVSLGRLLDDLGILGAWVDARAEVGVGLRGTLRPVALEGPLEALLDGFTVLDRPWNDPAVVDRPRTLLPPDRVVLGLRPLRLAGRWGFSADHLEFRRLAVSTGETRGLADARLDLSARGGAHVGIRLDPVDLSDLGPIAGLPFAGRGRLSGRVGGPFRRLGADGSADLAGFAIGAIPFGSIRGDLTWSDGDRIEARDVLGHLGESTYTGTVAVRLAGDVPLSIEGEIPSGRVEDLLEPFGLRASDWGDARGAVSGRFQLEGPVSRLSGRVDARIDELTAYGEHAHAGRARLAFDAGRVELEDLELHKGGGRLRVRGAVDPRTRTVRGTVRTIDARLEDLDLVRASQPRLSGRLGVRLEVGGTLEAVTGTLAVSLADVRAGEVPVGGGRFTGRLEGPRLAFDGAMMEGALKAGGTLRFGQGLPYAARLSLSDVDAARLAAGLAGHARHRGRVTAVADLGGSLVDWARSSGSIQLERGELRTEAIALETTGPSRLTLDRGWLVLRRLGVAGPRLRLVLTGGLGLDPTRADPAPSIELGVEGRVDLALLELASPSVEKAGGALLLDASLIGPLASMELVGGGRVEGGLLEWRGIESRVTGLAAELTFSQSSVLVERASGRWAGGVIFGSGSLELEGFAPRAYEATVRASEVRPRFAFSKVELSGVLDGELRAAGTPARLSLKGDLAVRRGRVTPKLDLASLVGSRRAVEVYDPGQETVDFDIGLSGDEPIRVRNDDVDLELKGEIRLTGTNERFGMLGGATLQRGGRVTFLGRGYLMEGGTIEFRDRFRWDPRYDLYLSADACAVRIRLNLVGSLESVQTLFGGNPDMDQQDIVSCLVRGVRTSDLDQDLASFASSALLKLTGVDREVKKVLPVDQLDVTTEYSSQARAYEPRVLVAKELAVLDRSARLEYSTSLLRTDDQRAALRMRLAPRLNLQLGWTSSEDVPYGDWGVDLERRWEW